MRVFDIESDGLLDTITALHCINVIDRASGKRLAFNGGVYKDGSPAPRDGTIDDGLQYLEEANCIAGQNIIGYDIPAIQKLYPNWKPQGRVFDTKVCANVIWPDIAERDHTALARGRLPEEFKKKGLIGKQSLESWGYRLGEYKGDFKPSDYKDEDGEPHTWKTIGFTQEMDTYGRQDPEVTLKLVEKIESKSYSQECLDLEHRVAQIIFKQHERGWCFSVAAAEQLTMTLQRRHAEIAGELSKLFQPWYAPEITKGSALFTPKKDNKKAGYVAGAQLSKVKHVVFNPASRDHISDRLMKLRGWRPATFTPEGKPQVDETVLGALPYPEAKTLAEYLLIEKRLGQVALGNQAWLKKAVRTGIYGVTGEHHRVHGTVNTNGAVTGRMTHAHPNVAQSPTVTAPYGKECRSCWTATPGLVLVGCDAEGLELRMLGHFVALYDGGEYARAVVEGKKEDGTDVHTLNQRSAGLNERDGAKTFIYALLYGAGDYKLGLIAYDDFTAEQRARFNAKYTKKRERAAALKRLGGAKRARLMGNLPALKKLTDAVKRAVLTRGHLRGLDGRLLHVRSEHAALNTLLQSGGAVVMKRALVLLDDSLEGGVPAVGNIHDEIQMETKHEFAPILGTIAADSIRRAGEHYKLRCPLAGSFNVGANWAETH